MKLVDNWQRKNRFKELVYMGDQRKVDSSNIPRLYVLVRDDLLPPLHQGIQAAHACILLATKIKVDPNSYLILLGATQRDMIGATYGHKYKMAVYVDRGLVNPENMPVATAMAFEPMSLSEGNKLFGHLKRAE